VLSFSKLGLRPFICKNYVEKKNIEKKSAKLFFFCVYYQRRVFCSDGYYSGKISKKIGKTLSLLRLLSMGAFVAMVITLFCYFKLAGVLTTHRGGSRLCPLH